jgi:cytochrome c-type biogenesis protein CcmH
MMIKAKLGYILSLSLLVIYISFSSFDIKASGEILSFDSHEQQEVYEELIVELRCPKCQNQNIADSNADLATDLREKVYAMAKANQSKAEIKQFMLDRFGEFVLYEPQFSPKTWLLWLGPIFLLFFALFFCIKLIAKNASQLSDEDEQDETKPTPSFKGNEK